MWIKWKLVDWQYRSVAQKVRHYQYQSLLQMKFKMMLNDFSKLDDQISSYKVCQFEKKKKETFLKGFFNEERGSCNWFTRMSQVLKEYNFLKVVFFTLLLLMTSPEFVGFFFLDFKLEVAQVFWKFMARVENGSDCKTHIVRSNNGKPST